MGQNIPAPPNYQDLVRQQAQAGAQAARPDQTTPFATSGWTFNPTTGQWQQRTQLAGGLGQAASGLGEQAAQLGAQGLNFGALPAVGTGDEARQQALESAMGAARSQLDPMFAQRGQALDARLAAQGLLPGSAAARRGRQELAGERGGAYQQALAGAIGQATQAGQAITQQDMARRQQAMAELLRARAQPLEELQALQNLTSMPGFQAAPTPDLMGAAQAQYEGTLAQQQLQQQQMSDLFGGLGDLGGALGGLFMLSDVRVKRSIRRHGEALPGVALVSWEYLAMPGARFLGVLAQELRRACPWLVIEGSDGLLRVNYSGLLEVF